MKNEISGIMRKDSMASAIMKKKKIKWQAFGKYSPFNKDRDLVQVHRTLYFQFSCGDGKFKQNFK